ncbi:hypothetical protein G6F65_019979 [Rhizopus arrhizus]|nr:hypothetical protein G6F65_019979 [Rhizopus arrhizus]
MSSSRTTARSSADGPHHVLLAIALADAVEEITVDLDEIGLHLGPQLQVGIAYAVIVQGDAHAALPQAREGAAQFAHVVRQRVLFGQFDDDARRGQVDQRRARQVQEQLAGRFVVLEALGTGPEAGQLHLRVQPLAPRFGEEGVGIVQGGIGWAADQAFMAVDAAVRQVDDGLVAGAEQPFAQNAGQAG